MTPLTARQLELAIVERRVALMAEKDGQGLPTRTKCPELRVTLSHETWRDVMASMEPKHVAGLMEDKFCDCQVVQTQLMPYGLFKIGRMYAE